VIADIATFEVVVGMIRDRYQRFEVAGVCELVEVHHATIAMLNQMANNSGADKPCPTGYDNCFQTLSRRLLLAALSYHRLRFFPIGERHIFGAGYRRSDASGQAAV